MLPSNTFKRQSSAAAAPPRQGYLLNPTQLDGSTALNSTTLATGLCRQALPRDAPVSLAGGHTGGPLLVTQRTRGKLVHMLPSIKYNAYGPRVGQYWPHSSMGRASNVRLSSLVGGVSSGVQLGLQFRTAALRCLCNAGIPALGSCAAGLAGWDSLQQLGTSGFDSLHDSLE